MNKLKKFTCFKQNINFAFHSFFLNNFSFKNFYNLNNYFIFKNKIIEINSIEFQNIQFLKNSFFALAKKKIYVTNVDFSFKILFFLLFFMKLSTKILFIYFKKEKNKFICGFLGLYSLIVNKSKSQKTQYLNNQFCIKFKLRSALNSRRIFKKQQRFFIKLISNKIILNKQFQFFNKQKNFNLFNTFLNKSFLLRLNLIIIPNNFFLNKKQISIIATRKQFFYLKKKKFNLNMY